MPELIETIPLDPTSLLPEESIADPPVKSCLPPEISILPPTDSPLDTVMSISPPWPLTAVPPITPMEPVETDALDVPVVTLIVPLFPLEDVSELFNSTLPLAADVDAPLIISNVPPFCDTPEPDLKSTDPPMVEPVPALVDTEPPIPVLDAPATTATSPLFVAASLDSTIILPAFTGLFDVTALKAPDVDATVCPVFTMIAPLARVPPDVVTETRPLAPVELPSIDPLAI